MALFLVLTYVIAAVNSHFSSLVSLFFSFTPLTLETPSLNHTFLNFTRLFITFTSRSFEIRAVAIEMYITYQNERVNIKLHITDTL